MNMLIDYFIQGLISGLGMFVMMTVLGTITFFILKSFITKTIKELWENITGSVDYKGSIYIKENKDNWNEHDKLHK